MKSSTFSTEINGGYDTDQAPFQKTNTTNSGFSKMCKKINQSDNQEDEMLLDDQFEVEPKNNQYLTAANFCSSDTIQKTKMENEKANPQIVNKWSSEKNHRGNEAMSCLQKTIEKLKYQAEYFEGEYEKYKNMCEDQQKIIMNMRKQIKNDKIEYQIFQATVKAKLQSFMKVKESEIAGLNQQIASKSKQIQQFQVCIKRRSNPPGMTIQIIQDCSNVYIQNLQKIITQQEHLLAANYAKIQQATQQIFKITVQNINLKSELLNLQHLIRNIEFDKSKVEDQRNAEVKKNSKIMQTLAKGEKDIRAMGALIMALLNGEPNAELNQDIQRLVGSNL